MIKRGRPEAEWEAFRNQVERQFFSSVRMEIANAISPQCNTHVESDLMGALSGEEQRKKASAKRCDAAQSAELSTITAKEEEKKVCRAEDGGRSGKRKTIQWASNDELEIHQK